MVEIKPSSIGQFKFMVDDQKNSLSDLSIGQKN
jgi:hypothetical protein